MDPKERIYAEEVWRMAARMAEEAGIAGGRAAQILLVFFAVLNAMLLAEESGRDFESCVETTLDFVKSLLVGKQSAGEN